MVHQSRKRIDLPRKSNHSRRPILIGRTLEVTNRELMPAQVLLFGVRKRDFRKVKFDKILAPSSLLFYQLSLVGNEGFRSRITPVEPCRPVPTQLSLSLTRMMPANLRFGALVSSMIAIFAFDLTLLYTQSHDFLPNSRTSVSTASRRKRPDADCRSNYASRLLRDR